MHKAKYLLVCLFVLLGGCASMGGKQANQKAISTACNGYAHALATLSAFRAQGKLTKGEINQVNKIVKKVHPICTAKTIPDPTTALMTVNGAVNTLQSIQVPAK